MLNKPFCCTLLFFLCGVLDIKEIRLEMPWSNCRWRGVAKPAVLPLPARPPFTALPFICSRPSIGHLGYLALFFTPTGPFHSTVDWFRQKTEPCLEPVSGIWRVPAFFPLNFFLQVWFRSTRLSHELHPQPKLHSLHSEVSMHQKYPFGPKNDQQIVSDWWARARKRGKNTDPPTPTRNNPGKGPRWYQLR